MNPRYLLFILIIFVMPWTFVPDTDTQVNVLPDTPRRFKVCVSVRPDDGTHLDERLETFVRRELRALGDVDLVQEDSHWHYLLAYDILELTRELDGTKTGNLAIANAVLRGVSFLSGYDPEVDIIDDAYGRPGYLLGLHPAYWFTDGLHEYAIENVGIFDKNLLEPLRKE